MYVKRWQVFMAFTLGSVCRYGPCGWLPTIRFTCMVDVFRIGRPPLSQQKNGRDQFYGTKWWDWGIGNLFRRFSARIERNSNWRSRLSGPKTDSKVPKRTFFVDVVPKAKTPIGNENLFLWKEVGTNRNQRLYLEFKYSWVYELWGRKIALKLQRKMPEWVVICWK